MSFGSTGAELATSKRTVRWWRSGTFDDGLTCWKFLQHNRVDAIFLLISTFRRWMAYYWRKTSISLPISRLLSSSPPKEHAVEAFELEARLTIS